MYTFENFINCTKCNTFLPMYIFTDFVLHFYKFQIVSNVTHFIYIIENFKFQFWVSPFQMMRAKITFFANMHACLCACMCVSACVMACVSAWSVSCMRLIFWVNPLYSTYIYIVHNMFNFSINRFTASKNSYKY